MLERRRELAGNETRTRNALIDPVLRSLEWDVSNPSQVTTEYELPSGRVDYALLDQDGNVAIIVEAKKLGEDLTKHRGQLARYAYESRPTFAILTDGDVWEIHKIQALENKFEFHHIGTYPLSEINPLQSARKLFVLWREDFEPEQILIGAEKIVRPSLQPPRDTESFGPEGDNNPDPPIMPPTNDWISFPDLLDTDKSKKPLRIRFRDGKTVEIARTSWAQVRFEAMQWLSDQGLIDEAALPLATAGGYTLASQNSLRRDGSNMLRPEKLRKAAIYVDLHHSAKDAIQRSLEAYTMLGEDPGLVHVQLDD